MASYNNIKVVARFRPTNNIESRHGGQPVVDFQSEDTCAIHSREGAGSFTFDRVFDTSAAQTDVFDFSIRTTVDDILKGYNGTVFAYGQTGSGKSYTMMGPDIDDDNVRGIIPRIVEQIFASIMSSPGNIEYTVRVSYMEIYMERIRDLLQPQNDNLPIHEEKTRGVYVQGLLELYVASVAEVYEVMRRGGLARATAATNMNQESSRSHSIFVITISQKDVETQSAKSGQLFLVDLAGSEKVGKTGASGQTLEEAKKINKSLSALGLVINSLTDGKSTHIPYRDSKLTRILQESLGGNSRTTLIINCSPSSFNADETISTLRFGVRAKKIQNKAKINAELSPAELKAQLKKAQAQIMTYQEYIGGLEGEVLSWRSGEKVPADRWTPSLNRAVASSGRPGPRPVPGTPSRSLRSPDSSRPDTPSRVDGRFDVDRIPTPTIVLEKDERDEFLRRENELQDQLADRETQVEIAERELQLARDELETLRAQQKHINTDHERLNGELGDFRLRVERLQFENRETAITMDQLREANSELTNELDDIKQQLLNTKLAVTESASVQEEKDKKKAERMAEMMTGLKLDGIEFGSGRAEGIVRRHEMLEERLEMLEKEYEHLLERNLSEDDAEEIKQRLGNAYVGRQNYENDLVEDLRDELKSSNETNRKLKDEVFVLQQRIESGPASPNGTGTNGIGRTLQQQLADFDIMKKSLMRDLQNRCERVVELEISLDETREQYNNVLKASNNRAQQKKMAFLERNLEQLTHVQRQLVEQNSHLKKESAMAERKMMARNERIQNLESLLQESQENLLMTSQRFDAQISAFRERYEAEKAKRVASTASDAGGGGFGLSSVGSRIAKPLRGGGEAISNGSGPTAPGLANLQAQEKEGGKRGSWFFNQKGSWT